MYVIDKSRFEAEELAQYEALIAKALVDPEANQEEMEEEFEPARKKPAKKAAEETGAGKGENPAAELDAVKRELDDFKKSVEMEKFTSMAKKYAPLGKKEDELAKTLYNLQKSDKTSYDAFVGVLDEHLDLVNKSGIYGEIGKSGSTGTAGNSTVSKIETAASEIQKADPTLTREVAIMKAWENHPELIAEYDEEYNR